MKKKSLRSLARAIVETLAPLTEPKRLEEASREIVRTMHERGLGLRLRELEAEIGRAWREVMGAETVTVTSAHRLSEKALTGIESAANGASVRTVIDGQLIGGAVVRVDDRLLDGSIAGQIAHLRQTLNA